MLDALSQSYGDDQDIVFKFILPASLRDEILKNLAEKNINAFTLYGDENSLMETLANQEIKLR